MRIKIKGIYFLQDCKKHFRKTCANGVGEFRYYLCPEGLIKETEIPEKWGLLYQTKEEIIIIKKGEKQETNLLAERNMLTSYIRNYTTKKLDYNKSLWH